jgi:hypothetical protein
MSATAFMYANYYGKKECQAYLEGLGCDTEVTWLGASWATHPDKMWDNPEDEILQQAVPGESATGTDEAATSDFEAATGAPDPAP